MTICPLPERTTRIIVVSKYWSTRTAAGNYTWKATTADGATATATIRLPVQLTLTRTKRGAKTHLRARMTANGAPVRAKAIHLLAGGRLVAYASCGDGVSCSTLAPCRSATCWRG